MKINYFILRDNEGYYERNKYLDFYYKDMALTISNYGEEIHLGDDIDTYNIEEIDGYIDHFNNIGEIKKILEENCEENL